jgi:hypothetical protein
MSQTAQKTLLFCTAFARRDGPRWQSWDERYRLWFDAIKLSKLHYDQLLIIDDGSDALPDWPDLPIVRDTDATIPNVPALLYHFSENLGRRSVSDFPGWVRSFFFAAKYAAAHGFTKVVHIESDAFLVSNRAVDYFNAVTEGWIALWCPRWSRPETGLQIIAGAAMQTYLELAQRDVESYAGVVVEDDLPFTHVDHTLRGDRYGEYTDQVPYDADYSMQTFPRETPGVSDVVPHKALARPFFWWITGIGGRVATLAECVRQPAVPPVHAGPYFTQFLATLDKALAPELVFESGSSGDFAIRHFSRSTVCVDPGLHRLPERAAAARTLFFKTDSARFFRTMNPAAVLGGPIDLAFLDGEHLFEMVLDDFIHTERLCQAGSQIILHDCLPLNTRMAERVRRSDPDEAEATRAFWTGDAWKMLPILRKYRPDLTITVVDCAPTGLVICSGLNPGSTVLADHEAEIRREFAGLDLAGLGLAALWGLFPLYDGGRLMASPALLRERFDVAAAPRPPAPIAAFTQAPPDWGSALPGMPPPYSQLHVNLQLPSQGPGWQPR